MIRRPPQYTLSDTLFPSTPLFLSLLCTRAALSRFNDAAPVRLLSTVLTSGSDREWAEFDRHLCRKAAMQAYDEAGIGPSDVSVAEVHDASAFAEIIQVENLGFCEVGQGGWIAARSEEHTSELQSLMLSSSAVYCLKHK